MEYAIVWSEAVRSVREGYLSLPSGLREKTEALCRRIAAEKEALHALVREAGGESACRSCGGECCPSGRYHVSIGDAIGFVALGGPLFTPRFDGPACPYLGETGCLMDAGFRPFPCVIFTCDKLQELLTDDGLGAVSQREESLRKLSAAMEDLLDARVTAPLLHAAEERRPIIFGRSHGYRDR
jgi:hypothetical protein